MKRLLLGSAISLAGLFTFSGQAHAEDCAVNLGPTPYAGFDVRPSNIVPVFGGYVKSYSRTSNECNHFATPRDWVLGTPHYGGNAQHYANGTNTGQISINNAATSMSQGGLLAGEASGSVNSSGSMDLLVSHFDTDAGSSKVIAANGDALWFEDVGLDANASDIVYVPFQVCTEFSSEAEIPHPYKWGPGHVTAYFRGPGLYSYWANEHEYSPELISFNGSNKFDIPATSTESEHCITGNFVVKGTRASYSTMIHAYNYGLASRYYDDENNPAVYTRIRQGALKVSWSLALPPGMNCTSASGLFPGCDRVQSERHGAFGSYIDGSMGFKHQQETDYSGGVLSFTRSYRSDAIWLDSMGERWRHNLDRKLNIIDTNVETTSYKVIDVLTESGGVYSFREESAGVWSASDKDITTSLVSVMDGSTLTGYMYTTEGDAKEYYDTDGKITRIEYLGGGSLDFSHDLSDRLASVTDEHGLTLTFGYNSSDQISSVTTPNGLFSYSYDGNGNLTGVVKPDGKTLTYHYENTSFVNALTGITDEENIRFVTYAYDNEGRATSTVYSGGVGSYSVAYNADGTTTITNSLNQDEVHHFETVHGVRKPVLIEREASANVPAASRSFSYDVNGFTDSETNWNGVVTSYVRDARGLVTLQTEAEGTAAERTTDISYETSTRQRDLITVQGKTVDFDYDADGRVISETVTDTATGETRITSYTYHFNTMDGNGNTVLGKLATKDGPRTDVNDVTSYTYDGSNRLVKTTNALGHETETLTFDSANRPLTQLDENGVQTTLTYDTLGRLATSTKAGAVTSYTYDGIGNVLTVTEPNGVVITNTYDDARRLTSVTDSLGNTMTYTLDNAGNRTSEVFRDNGGTLRFTQSKVYDTVSRLLETVDANLDKTVNAYDDNGNVVSITDGNLNATTQAFDGLNRLISSTDALNGQTVNSINELDQKTSVTDPRSNATSYTYNAFGDVISQTSPDTGVTTFTVDKAGNTITRTDARGEVITYTYDALNRLTSTSYASDSSLDVSLAYDLSSGCGSSVGRLCSVTDAGGTTDYVYDNKGLLTSVTETRGALSFTKSYGYDAAGTLTSITYPSGRVVTYGLDAKGQVNSVADGGTSLVSNISYLPFGGIESLVYGNGVALTNVYNTAYQLTSKQHGGLFYDSYVYDGVGNITSKSSTSYNYDALNRLTGENSDSYTYDAIANRLTENVGGVGETYSYPSDSSRLSDIGSTSVITDAAGNITTDNQRSYVYDAAGHVEEVKISGSTVGAYVYDANNQRVSKTVGGVTTHFVYGQNGLLYGEYDNTGALIREYVWLGSEPIAQVDTSSTVYVHTDHLGTPRVASNSSGASVWSWDSDAFGNGTPTGSATVNLRFAGQYWDTESGLHYNWNRYYDPKTGRYISSDPIGLEGGLNTFAYSMANPVMYVDPEGLKYFNDPSNWFTSFADKVGAIADRITDTLFSRATSYATDLAADATSPLARSILGCTLLETPNAATFYVSVPFIEWSTHGGNPKTSQVYTPNKTAWDGFTFAEGLEDAADLAVKGTAGVGKAVVGIGLALAGSVPTALMDCADPSGRMKDAFYDGIFDFNNYKELFDVKKNVRSVFGR